MVKLHVIRADTRDVGKQLVRVPASLSGATAIEYRGRDVPAQVDSRLGGNEIAIDEMMRGYLVVQLGKEYDFVVHATDEPEAPYLLVTAGAKAYPEAVKFAIALAYERIRGATDYITLDTQPRVVATHLREARGEGYEDEGRTYRAYWPKGVRAPMFYVKLDDYGTPEALKESLGKYYPQGSSTQTVITIMLATED